MNILLFLPSSQIAYSILSEAIYFVQNGKKSFFLSTSPKGEMHMICQEYGIPAYSLNINNLNYRTYLSASYALMRFVLNNNIDIVISNNLQGNFIAILSRFLHKKRTVLVRHHTDYIFTENNKNAKTQLQFINKYGKEFIAISDRVKTQMIKEGISPNKIYRMNLGFDFNLFPKTNYLLIDNLKKENKSCFNICTIARLIPLKRHVLLFEAILILNNRGMDIKLWVIGDGELMSPLKEMAKYSQLDHAITFTGYINNPENYLAACDLLVHVSQSEASSHVIREASLVNTPILVCKDVGDFDDYIEDEVNGFLIEKDSSPSQIADKILQLSTQKGKLTKTAIELHKTVLERFNINETGKKLMNIIEHV